MAKNLISFKHIKCGKKNGQFLQPYVQFYHFERLKLQFRHFGAKIIVYFAVADILAPKMDCFFFGN